MREVNFSIPNVNKASVGITTALYDRRALDCTSTLPLINSLNHLAYLTTSSARIRDILTVDGGIERLVSILKEGRSKDMMSMWKWNLAFQCVVNIGVRGTEDVRTRVVEADMVPVIATILENYIQATDKLRQKSEANAKKAQAGHNNVVGNRARALSGVRSLQRPTAPNFIDIPSQNEPLATHTHTHALAPGHRPNASQLPVDHPAFPLAQQARTVGVPDRHQLGLRPIFPHQVPAERHMALVGSLQAARDVDRMPAMVQAGGASLPVSPTTPNPPLGGTFNSRIAPRNGRLSRHQRSVSGESDDPDSDEMSNAPVSMVTENESILDVSGVVIDQDSVDAPMTLDGEHDPERQDADTFNITHRSPLDGSLANGRTQANNALSPNPPTINPGLAIPAALQPSRFMMENASSTATLPTSMPREEDVLMSLQLLAYVSKYCELRTYFQRSHLVPSLSIKNELYLLDDESERVPPACVKDCEQEIDEEYLLPDDYNIFPLVEKFTMRHHPPDMQYWAGVVMRNLCRKDDSRGGIRQCAYYECGKWEEYTRQFAKCRRCRRTKYCSKDCQKRAWVYHRHWCVAAQS
ncbi:hypothetical protein EX30DRAFT_52257 [Ascodesmis nigricans]|uniref:MYND-type zinc finger protein samB n=1 Tax=Ascodesmis nigricans TaxID=341454 RepID=A0A4S2MV92_9PEZI|nr:hypothetical protein EX30DRAFT_52257 [Ascodesmis nigricans]